MVNLSDGLLEVIGFKGRLDIGKLFFFNVPPVKLGQVHGVTVHIRPPPQKKSTYLHFDGEARRVEGPFTVIIDYLYPVRFLNYNESPVTNITNELVAQPLPSNYTQLLD